MPPPPTPLPQEWMFIHTQNLKNTTLNLWTPVTLSWSKAVFPKLVWTSNSFYPIELKQSCKILPRQSVINDLPWPQALAASFYTQQFLQGRTNPTKFEVD